MFNRALCLCRLWVLLWRVGRKSAINIECHVGSYDVLIDCLTTTVSRRIRISERFEAVKDIWRSQEIFSFDFTRHSFMFIELPSVAIDVTYVWLKLASLWRWSFVASRSFFSKTCYQEIFRVSMLLFWVFSVFSFEIKKEGISE